MLLFALLISSLVSNAQYKKFVFLEGGGSGVLVNAVYDMRITKNQNNGIGFRLGIGNTFYTEDIKGATTIPIGINYLLGKNKSFLILGANTTFGIFDKNLKDRTVKHIVPSLEVGYRFVPQKRGFGFQVTYTPLFNTVDGLKPIYLGIGLGYSWK